MSNEPLTKLVSERICKHMNKDHKDAVLALAKHFGGFKNAKKARMIELSAIAMKVEVDGETTQIDFDHALNDSKDAHQTLVSMLKVLNEK